MIEYNVKIQDNGDKEWFLNGKLHREDGPAIEYTNGDKLWFLNGERHREDGPAIERVNCYKSWFLNGKLHREDGPAIEWGNGNKEWYLNGVEYTETQYNQLRKNDCFENQIVEIKGKKYILKSVE